MPVSVKMATKPVYVLVLLLPAIVFSADRNDDCDTPNGEAASCVPFKDCQILRDAVASRNASAKKFASESQCGFDSDPLVCCGTVAFRSERGSKCTTPDGERSKCKSLKHCKPIYDGVQSRDRNAIEYARRSQCGYDIEPLVCCGLQKTASTVSRYFPDRAICGFEKDEDRVYGGQITGLDDHPWMVLLRYKNSDGTDAGFKCGGTLINQRYVLTAAHCVLINNNAGFELDSVRIGEWKISTTRDCVEGVVNEECNDPVIDMKVQEVIAHNGYDRRVGQDDIALLRLQRNVGFSDSVRPICILPPGSTEPSVGTSLTVVGWGSTENSSSSDYKMSVDLPIVSRSVCSQKIRQRVISEKQICAGAEKGKDSCLGDSGGPLLGKFAELDANRRQQWFQEAIVSYGVICGAKGIPAVYTRTSSYIDWMVKSMKSF